MEDLIKRLNEERCDYRGNIIYPSRITKIVRKIVGLTYKITHSRIEETLCAFKRYIRGEITEYYRENKEFKDYWNKCFKPYYDHFSKYYRKASF